MKNKGLLIALVATCIAFFIVAQRKKKDQQTDNNGVIGEDTDLAGGVNTVGDEEGKGKNNKSSEVLVENNNEVAPMDDRQFIKQELERKVTNAWNKYVDDKKQGVNNRSILGVANTVGKAEFNEYVQALAKEYNVHITVKTNGNRLVKIKIDF